MNKEVVISISNDNVVTLTSAKSKMLTNTSNININKLWNTYIITASIVAKKKLCTKKKVGKKTEGD